MDPLFADPMKGDYRLAADSPLATKGRNGGYIGAFPPIGKAAEPPAASPSPTPRPTPAKEQVAILRGQTLSIDPEVLDTLIAGLRGKAGAEAAKAPLGLVPFALLEMPGVSLGADFMENLTTAAINAGFQVADQGRLDAAIREMAIDEPGQMDLATAKEVGARAGCSLLLLGSITDRGETVLINVKLVEAATGRYLAAERIEVKKSVKN